MPCAQTVQFLWKNPLANSDQPNFSKNSDLAPKSWSSVVVVWASCCYPLLGRTRSRGRCWTAIQLSHNPKPSGRAVYGEVDGLDIRGWHSRRLFRGAIPHLCKQERKRSTRRRSSRTYAVFGQLQEGGCWCRGSASTGDWTPQRPPVIDRAISNEYVVKTACACLHLMESQQFQGERFILQHKINNSHDCFILNLHKCRRGRSQLKIPGGKWSQLAVLPND